MKFKTPIYRILFFAAWIVVLGGIVTLFIAANRSNKEHICKAVEVTINGGGNKIYINQADILKSVEKTAKGSVVKKHFSDINLTLLEKNLETNPWLRDAELYVDTKDVLHVAVWEREPVARVFNTAGRSFYIDTAGYTMPLLESYGTKLPVVTGFTSSAKRNFKDSVVLAGIKNILRFLSAHPFWDAQVGQIEITPQGKFELVPTIGSHIIKLGDGNNIENKLNRLMVFYKQVLPKAGLAKYSALDVTFDGQVVAIKKGMQSPVDSLQLQKNIQELIRRKALEQEADTMMAEQNLPIAIAPVLQINEDSLKAVAITNKIVTTTAQKTTYLSNHKQGIKQKKKIVVKNKVS